jgi:hypothetical protein
VSLAFRIATVHEFEPVPKVDAVLGTLALGINPAVTVDQAGAACNRRSRSPAGTSTRTEGRRRHRINEATWKVVARTV